MPLTQAEARYIFDNTLGCRYGTTIAGAAYGFMDIEGGGADGGDKITPMPVLLQWLDDPAQPAFEPRWHDRLWNTCGMIVALSPAGTVILVTRANPTAERYLFEDAIARGDGYTFRKCNLLPPNSNIVAAIPYGAGEAREEEADIVSLQGLTEVDPTTVRQLYDAILVAVKKLASGK